MNIRDQLKAAVRALLAQGEFGINASRTGGSCAYLTNPDAAGNTASCVVGLLLRDSYGLGEDKLCHLAGAASRAIHHCIYRGWIDSDAFSPEDAQLLGAAQTLHDEAATRQAAERGRPPPQRVPTLREALTKIVDHYANLVISGAYADDCCMNPKMSEAISIYREVLAEPQP